MFLVDNLLMAPGKALFLVFQELARKAQEEWLDDDSIKKELQEVYALLDSGQIDEREFEAKEYRLLERLEQIAKVKFQQKWGTEQASPETMTLPSGPVLDAELSAPPLQDGHEEPQPTPMTENSSDLSGSTFGMGILQALRTSLDLGQQTPAASKESASPVYQIEADTTTRPLFEAEIEDPPPPAGYSQPLPAVAALPATPSHFVQPIAPAPVATPSASPPVPRTIAMPDVVESAIRSLALTKLKLSSVTSVAKAEDGWRVGIELVERAAVPDTSDLLGVYEVRLDDTATVTRYERTRVRRRNDLSR